MTDLFAGRYALGQLRGSGGMGKVFVGEDRRLGRTVAVKLVPTAGADPVARQRFVREARSAAAFSHPNAVAIYDAGEADGYLYLVMELVDGPSLADRLAAPGPIDPDEARHIATAVLAALAAAHAVGVVHRDVKPGNILLGPHGSVKLADFGIAKRLDDAAGDVTIVGDVIGTPKYLAPELTEGAPASPASDIYAVGVVLFEMLTGRPPFDADTPLATALAHRDRPAPDLAAVRPGIPADLAAATRTAMAKEPGRRFASAADMAAALTGRGRPGGPSSPAAGSLAPTEVVPTGAYRPSRSSRWWLALAAALLLGGAALTYLVVGSDDPNGSAPSSPPLTAATVITLPVAPSTLPATVAATGATAAATMPPPVAATLAPTVAPTSAPTSSAATGGPVAPPGAVEVGTLEGVIATLAADPAAYGSKTPDIIRDLEKIRGNGRNAEREAANALAHAADWVAAGELDPVVLAMLEPVLSTIVGDLEDDEEESDGGDD